ncbi:tetratricopeptide repeat protein [Sandaracinus amylolyticus]|uniref:tetratricopeptide repeat protein n=1 Tax=Sandaracinus amylolyticus TaxID=927083 RepID=UPI001F365109|nr:tetratricopeptide repeat protein [Sandaracinus amylolyticus]UJR84018.1 Hypothetical protein I5071_60890 [Sandaracinus amylolyticus]
MRLLSRLALVLAFVPVLAMPSRGHAQDAVAPSEAAPEEPPPSPELAEAMERYEGAERLFEQGDYRGALAEFQRIYELLEGHPNQFFVLYNLGRAYEELHRYDLAIDMYRRYLDEGGEGAEDRAEVEASLRALERLLGTVAITIAEGGPDTAEVWLGEWQVGVAPGEVHIPGGQHTIEVRAQGYEVLRREIQVASRQRIELELELARLSDFRGVTPALFVTSTALAVASLGVAIGLGVNAMMLNQDAEECRDTAGCGLDPGARRAEIRDFALAADVMYGVAGLFAVSSVVLIFVTDWGSMPEPELMEAQPTALRVLPAIGPQHVGLVLDARF